MPANPSLIYLVRLNLDSPRALARLPWFAKADPGYLAHCQLAALFGEMAVGIGLLVGALTGVAAFFGALMNMSFLLAGSASTNPVLFTAAIGLMLAWRVAGYYGVDRWLLPMLGTPWRSPVAERRPISDTA